MSKKWTVETAKAYIGKVQKNKQQIGLTYYSAVDFLINHSNTNVNLHPLATKSEDNDDSNRADI